MAKVQRVATGQSYMEPITASYEQITGLSSVKGLTSPFKNPQTKISRSLLTL
jgi:hypothetical protein